MSDAGTLMIDRKEYGRRARAARILAGYDSVKDAVNAIEEATGTKISARHLYAVERGEVPLLIDWYFALSLTYNPPGGLRYWEPAMSPRLQELVLQRVRDRVNGDGL